MHPETIWRHKLFASALVILLTVVIMAVPLSFAWATPITRNSIVELTNNQRAQLGVSALKPNYALTMAAQNKAEDMLRSGYWEHYHNGKTPWDWMREAGYKFSSAGENLAIDFEDADSLLNAWMDSTTHRQNLINPAFEEIGVGIAQGWFNDHETIIVVQMFGKPTTDINLAQINKNKDHEQIAGTNNVDELYQNNDEGTILTKLVDKIKVIYHLIYLKTLEMFS